MNPIYDETKQHKMWRGNVWLGRAGSGWARRGGVNVKIEIYNIPIRLGRAGPC